jgi:dienelactone hydrolase
MNRRLFVRGIVAAGAARPSAVLAADVEIDGFDRKTFVDDTNTRRTYYRGGTGPPVMVLHEIYGLTPDVVSFANRLIRRGGFTVYLPVLFGTPNKSASFFYSVSCIAHVCVSREFAVFERGRSSPVAQSLRALGNEMFAEHAGNGIGVIGLCLTGNFALAMMADRHLVAPVISEPSLPFVLGPGRRDFALDAQEISKVHDRIAEGCSFVGYRFKHDEISPKGRFDHLKDEFRDGFDRHDLAPTRRSAHSVFTAHYSDDCKSETREAFEHLVIFLHDRLGSVLPPRSAQDLCPPPTT